MHFGRPTSHTIRRSRSLTRDGSYILRSASVDTSLSRIGFAGSRLRLAFSAPSVFNDLASDTSMPPYLLRQR